MELFPDEGENIGIACEEAHLSSLRSMESSEANPSVPSMSSSLLTVGETDDSTVLEPPRENIHCNNASSESFDSPEQQLRRTDRVR